MSAVSFRSRSRRRPGLTLIELVVVLVILVALAGILVPMLPSMLTRAHTSSGATNCAEISKFVQTYEQLYQSQPTDFDSLTDGTTPVGYLPGGATPAGGAIIPGTLTGPQRAALFNAGITRLQNMVVTMGPGNSPTFNPYSNTITDLSTDTTVAFATEAAVEGDGGVVSDDAAHTGDVYVIVGFGKRCSMIGKVTSEPPLHFGESAADNAATVYSRYGLIYRVGRGNGTATPTDIERAVFVGVVGIHDDGISGLNSHLEEYYNIVNSQ